MPRRMTSCGSSMRPRPGRRPMPCTTFRPRPTIDFTSHIVRPEAILAIARQCYGAAPRAFLLAIRGYGFEFVEELTPGAAGNLAAALAMLKGRIRAVQKGRICAVHAADAP